jgi:peptidyl-prolyl cis-trans isomerase A (cyclophilin A)
MIGSTVPLLSGPAEKTGAANGCGRAAPRAKEGRMKNAWTASFAFVALVPGLAACGNDAPASSTAQPEPTHAAAAPSQPAQPPPAATQAAAPPHATGAPEATTGANGEPAATQAKGPFPESTDPLLKEPKKAEAKAPNEFKVKFETTAGDFTVLCHRDWAEHGVDRFYNLVKIGFFDDNAFFRVAKGFVVQFGIHGNPEVSKLWKVANLPVDKVKESNKKGYLTYAMAGSPTTRSTQLFFNLNDNARLDKDGFAPICKIEGDGLEVVEKLDGTYGETASREQPRIESEGNVFLRKRYPKLDYIKTARLEGDEKGKKGKKAAKEK